MGEELDMQALRSDVASLKAQMAAQAEHNSRVDAWMQRISEQIHQRSDKSFVPIIGTGLTGIVVVATILISLGTMALAPVEQAIARHEDRLELLSLHDDGHPDKIRQIIDQLDKVHTREREVNRESILRFENRIDNMETRLSVLDTIAEERTKRFKIALDLRDEKFDLQSEQRWRSSQQKEYAKGVERRFREIEKRLLNDEPAD